MQQRQQPAEPLDLAAAICAPAGYDWTRFGYHRLRVPDGILIDTPLARGAESWLGTLWSDNRAVGGWARMLWEPDSAFGRGWVVPARLAGGDVIEFGADQPGTVVRWYGIIDSYDAIEWLTVQGPYPDPAAALHDADRRLADIRFRPSMNPVAARPCTRRPRFRHRVR